MAPAPHTVRVFRFGPFAVDARTGELSQAGQRTPLRDQPLHLLLALLERPGELVTRDELTRRLWPADTFVDFDRGLNKAMNHLRDALGDSADHPRFIETLPRKGYRFIAPVSLDADNHESAAEPAPPGRANSRVWLAVTAACLAAAVVTAIAVDAGGIRRWIVGQRAVTHIRSLAVIPLENLSGNPEEEYFADGMTDALITDLAKIASLRITSRTSVMKYKEKKRTIKDIGRELDVDAVVEGTVTRSGGRVRITAQLIQVSTDMHLWAEAYERDVSEVLELQRAVATDIARRIDIVVRPLDRPRIVQPEAYGLYLKGRYAFYQYTSEGWQRAVEHFTRAIDRDPTFASAYSGLADTYVVAGAYDAIPADEALTRGKAAAAKALALDDRLAGAHYALATAHTWYDWDWPGAEREFRRALELDPNDALGRNWYGGYLSLRRRHQEAIAEHERARDLDPQSLIVNANLARALYWARRYGEAITQARRTLELDPRFGIALFWLEGSLRHQGLLKEAVALRQQVSPERAQIVARTFERDGFPALLRECGAAYRNSGSLVIAARCYAQSGDTAQALALLEECSLRRCSSLVNAVVEPDFDVLRSEPRFQQLLSKVDPDASLDSVRSPVP
ncbi:MAG TPA: winged helix-turn-helix domain-containing protein [Vicinamibacterales bacterium]|nr:winged helix-turn-helix domain-containing protein [Vicinamibacterales bacterium]